MSTENQGDSKRKRDRSPAFPYISLTEAAERTEQLFKQYQRHPARVKNLGAVWGYSEGSSSLLRVVAALKSFGLVDDFGSGTDRKIGVSELGNRLVADKRPGAKEAALQESFANCEILARYRQHWGNSRPPDVECISELTIDDSFTSGAARKFISVYDDSSRYVSDSNDAEAFSPPEEKEQATVNAQSNTAQEEPATLVPQAVNFSQKPSEEQASRQIRTESFSLDEGDVVIQWPANLSKDGYEDFCDWIDLLKRKIGRSVITTSTDRS